MKIFIAAVILALAIMSAGCSGPRLTSYGMAEPVKNPLPVFEDGDIRVAMKIIDDCRYGMGITNKTPIPLRITWINSNAVTPGCPDDVVGYSVAAGPGVTDSGGITTVAPGATALAEAYPQSNAYTDKKGGHHVRPLYYVKGGAESADNPKGRAFGISLVAEVNDHARRYPLLLSLTPPH